MVLSTIFSFKIIFIDHYSLGLWNSLGFQPVLAYINEPIYNAISEQMLTSCFIQTNTACEMQVRFQGRQWLSVPLPSDALSALCAGQRGAGGYMEDK